MTTTTNRCLVVSVNEGTVKVAFNGRVDAITWEDLRSAARQDDDELRRIYKDILRQAEEKASWGPVEVVVEQDHTNVWWVVLVRAVYGGGPGYYCWGADEGCTHAHYETAAWEARNIVRELGDRCVRARF